MSTKKSAKKPAPDLKGATSNILELVAAWMETKATDLDLYGVVGKTTKEEAAVLAEAKKLAINYVRMGASQCKYVGIGVGR